MSKKELTELILAIRALILKISAVTFLLAIAGSTLAWTLPRRRKLGYGYRRVSSGSATRAIIVFE